MLRINQPEPVKYSSLGLQALCERIEPAGACDILELGPARTINVTFWSRYNPSIYVADLRSSLPLPALPLPQRVLFHADSLCLSVAAASVIAKCARDHFMVELDRHEGHPRSYDGVILAVRTVSERDVTALNSQTLSNGAMLPTSPRIAPAGTRQSIN